MARFISLLGLAVFITVGYGISYHRRNIRWRPVIWGIALQFLIGIFILRTPFGFRLFKALGDAVSTFLGFSDVGAQFVFGENYKQFFFAFSVLPTIIFFGAFIAILYYYGVLQWLVKQFAVVMMKVMKTSGPESLSAAANIFIGQIESPLMVGPYLKTMTKSEVHAIMTGGFATIAGGVMAAYISFGIPVEHLLAASVMSAPAGLAVSKLMYPETEPEQDVKELKVNVENKATNVIDAATSGALQGLTLALNVGTMLIAFLSLMAAANGILGWLGGLAGASNLSFQMILGFLLAPVAWLMGVPWVDCGHVGALLGEKTILNEFVAYTDLKGLIDKSEISQRSVAIATYALCGFANIGSIGMQIGGLAGVVPERQPDLAALGFRAMIGGTLACFMTACIAGFLL